VNKQCLSWNWSAWFSLYELTFIQNPTRIYWTFICRSYISCSFSGRPRTRISIRRLIVGLRGFLRFFQINAGIVTMPPTPSSIDIHKHPSILCYVTYAAAKVSLNKPRKDNCSYFFIDTCEVRRSILEGGNI